VGKVSSEVIRVLTSISCLPPEHQVHKHGDKSYKKLHKEVEGGQGKRNHHSQHAKKFSKDGKHSNAGEKVGKV